MSKTSLKDIPARSFVKGISWRLLASLDTFLLGWLVFGRPDHAIAIAGFELLTKVALYFLHERIWNIITFGRFPDGSISPLRSIIKTISYRFFGSIDTAFLSWLVTGKIAGAFTLSGLEVITKMLLYFIHERVWTRVRWGRIFINPEEVANGSASEEMK